MWVRSVSTVDRATSNAPRRCFKLRPPVRNWGGRVEPCLRGSNRLARRRGQARFKLGYARQTARWQFELGDPVWMWGRTRQTATCIASEYGCIKTVEHFNVGKSTSVLRSLRTALGGSNRPTRIKPGKSALM